MHTKKTFEYQKPIGVDRRWIGIGLGLFALLLRGLFSINPGFTEVVYTQGIFSLFRWGWDYTIGLLPIPLLYLALIGLSILLIRRLRIWRKSPRPGSWTHRLGRTVLNLAALAGLLCFCFLFLWGYNYQRLSIEQVMNMRLAQMDEAQLTAEFLTATEELKEASEQRHLNGGAAHPENLEGHVRGLLTQILDTLGYACPGRVRVRQVYPKGSLLQMGASGIYIPFVGEGHIDAALSSQSRPFVMAHEMAHGYGFGDEGSCSFLAYMACLQSANRAVRYSGYLEYWLEVAKLYRKIQPENYKEVRQNLPEAIQKDLDEIRKVYQKYPGFFPELSRKIYHFYLKRQGIQEGIKNYSRVVKLVAAYRAKTPEIPE